MAKLVFPTVTAPAYRGDLSAFRTQLQVMASTAQRSPGMKTDLLAQVAILTTYLNTL